MTVVASNFERKENDLYRTESWATEALLRHFPVTGLKVWEAAAGGHDMADVLWQHGAKKVFTSDIATYDRKQDQIFDFLRTDLPGYPYFDAIITNPPYGKGNRDAVRFAELALKRCAGVVALLLTAKFDSGKTRVHLFRDNPRFIAKIALLDRIQWFPGDTTGTEDHAWYVWTATHNAGLFRPTIRYEGRNDKPYSSGTSSRQADMAEESELLPGSSATHSSAVSVGVADEVEDKTPHVSRGGAPEVAAPPLSATGDEDGKQTGGDRVEVKRTPLRPHCLNPDLCAGSGRQHCYRCRKAAEVAEAA